MGWILKCVAALALVGFAVSAQAQLADDEQACYGRAYTAEDLSSNPGQSVVSMQIVMDASFAGEPPDHTGPSMIDTTMTATLRDRFGEFFVNSAVCRWMGEAEHYSCEIECDGGAFEIEPASDGTATLLNESLGFLLYGGCGFDGEMIEIQPGDPHAAFQLYELPIEACPIGLRTLYTNMPD
ncbi:MAG: hypothetical protein AAF414_16420 [Pseudomonadota bacterium]